MPVRPTCHIKIQSVVNDELDYVAIQKIEYDRDEREVLSSETQTASVHDVKSLTKHYFMYKRTGK